MKQIAQQIIEQAVAKLQAGGDWPAALPVEVQLERTKQAVHGDFSCNIAMLLAKPLKASPRQLAEQLVAAIDAHQAFERAEVAGPGFINLYFTAHARQQVVAQVLADGDDYGRSELGEGQRVHLEFVSANPTGPLHVGHGRGAAFGATLGNVLQYAGFEVHREYYVNDAGRQMDLLALSVWLRYLLLCGQTLAFPAKLYQGEYVASIADELYQQRAEACLPADVSVIVDGCAGLVEADESIIDGLLDKLVSHAQQLLDDDYQQIHQLATQALCEDIRQDLAEFGVEFDHWQSEHALVAAGAVEAAITALKDNGCVYEQDGALWFSSTEYGDEKDRVIRRANGQHTYFATDIAYHWHKFQQNATRWVDIFGADHHGYMARLRGALQALGCAVESFDIFLVQFAVLYRGDEKVSMSTRSGAFVTLRELRAEVGNDAARFFYAMRKPEQHLNFDLELAKSNSQDNPVYYVQYAHARICSVLRQLAEQGGQFEAAQALQHSALLTDPHEEKLLTSLARFPEWIDIAAEQSEPHHLTFYAQELAAAFHAYYNAVNFLVEDAALMQARLGLIVAVQQTLQNVFALLGISAPQKM